MINRIELQGDEQLKRLFEALPKRVTRTTINRVARRGAAIVRKVARDNTPVGPTGNLKRSIGIGTKKARGRDTGGVWVGARVKGNNKGFHSLLVAHGHKKRGGKGRVKGIGQWIQKSAGGVANQVTSTMTNEFQGIIEKEIGKHINRLRR